MSYHGACKLPLYPKILNKNVVRFVLRRNSLKKIYFSFLVKISMGSTLRTLNSQVLSMQICFWTPIHQKKLSSDLF
jgi:hypothetical protein